MKYVIPRNKLVPDPGFEGVLVSGALSRDTNGKPVGDQATLYRGTDMSFPDSAMLIEGMLYWYKEGGIYIPKFASYSDKYLDFAKQSAKIGVNTFLDGGIVEKIVGELPGYLGEMVNKGIEHTLFPEKEHDDLHLKVAAEELIKKGAVHLPIIQLVELEYQKMPAKFLRKPEHRFLFTYEQMNGERITYGMRIYSSNSQDAFVLVMLKARMQNELEYLINVIQGEQINSEQAWSFFVEKYRKLYGEKWREHGAELVTEFKKACDEELERKGFLGQNLWAAVLERIAPLVPYYKQVPMFREFMQFLEKGDGDMKFPTTL